MLQESVYCALYYELNEMLRNLQNQALTDEIWLQKSVLNAEMAISEHGREAIISNLKQVIEEPNGISDLILKRRFLSVAAKELQILELSKDIEWR